MRNKFYCLLILCFAQSLFTLQASAQSLECSPNAVVKCFEDFMEPPIVTDGEEYELKEEVDYIVDGGCDTTIVSIQYELIDSLGLVQAECMRTVVIEPAEDKDIIFPPSIDVTGYRLSEVYNKDVFNDGLFPLTGDCGTILYDYEDTVVELYPLLTVFRNWTGLNWCTSKVKTAIQRINLRDVPNDGIATQVYDCAGQEIKVDSFDILMNGEKLDWKPCHMPFDSIHVVLNCLAEQYLVEADDQLELRLHDIYNPLVGVSSLDLVTIQQHILGIRRMEDTCQIQAGDVNRDTNINGIDLVELRKMILGIYKDWPYGNTPTMTINGESKPTLTFTKADFPLPQLDIILANQGNVATNY